MITRLVSLVLVTTLGAAGCSSTATLRRFGAPPLEARIVGGSATSLYIEDDDGRRYRVPRASVIDVDHPGNVALAFGLGCLAMSSLFYFDHGGSDSVDSDSSRKMAALGYLVPGLLLAGWGGYVWFDSTSAAAHATPEPAMPMPTVVPVGMADVVLPPGVVPAGVVPPGALPAPAPRP
jgi:hypothetical protein